MEPLPSTDQHLGQLALRVALQTMKERCTSLQRRLTMLEDENQTLRERVDESALSQTQLRTSGSGSGGGSDPAENFQLRLQLSELQRQKAQLSDHVNMVSNENRKLWSRLSQMAKEQEGKKSTSNDDEIVGSPRSGIAGANANLIRSKTFTQHSPNPNLRHKMIENETTAAQDLKDISLDEVALDAGDGFADATEADLGFPCLTDDPASGDEDFDMEAKKCMENLQELHREALKQRQELNVALTLFKNKKGNQVCPDCVRKATKPETADKSLETDEPNKESLPAPHLVEAPTPPVNFIEEKIRADAVDKVCPMCGKEYTAATTFDSFRSHVEEHFIDDSSDVEASLDRNFEFVSHTVGNF